MSLQEFLGACERREGRMDNQEEWQLDDGPISQSVRDLFLCREDDLQDMDQ